MEQTTKAKTAANSPSTTADTSFISSMLHPRPFEKLDPNQAIQTAKKVISTELEVAQALYNQVDTAFLQACEILLSCPGKIILTGMGKSGHIAHKIAATFASTGSPAFFLHPGEAGHGDMGMISPHDVVLALSYSGQTEEILRLIPAIKQLQTPLVSMTSSPDSSLAQASHIHLHVPVTQEACPMGLAPTASTTAMLILGDTLAMVLSQAKGFTALDFAKVHPGGSLGRKLLLRVCDIMRQSDQIPHVDQEATVTDALFEITSKGMGMTAVLDQDQKIVGIFTDGDLRRTLSRINTSLSAVQIHEVMTRGCRTCSPDILATQALRLMKMHRINALLVTDAKNCLVGAISMHDLIQAQIT